MKIITKTSLAALLILFMVSCKNDVLDSFEDINAATRIVSAENINVAGIIKENALLKIPVKVSLSGAAGTAFQVGIAFDNDTLPKLILNNMLDKNTVLLQSGSVEYPNVINVAYGADSATAILSIKVSALEKYYGKKVATAFKLTNIGKGNTVNPKKSTFIIVINTIDVINYNEIHYLSIDKYGGTVLTIEQGKNYEVNSSGIKIPFDVILAGQAGRTFDVKAISDVDTIAKMIANQTLPANTILLTPNNYVLDSLIVFPSNKNSAKLSVNIPWSVFDANIAGNKNLAIAIKLNDPALHVLHPQNSMVVLLIKPSVNLDNNSFILGNGTGLLGQYFKNTKDLDRDGRKPDLERIDPVVDFDWGGGNPFGTNNDDNYSCRWKGKFLAPVRGEYIFYQTRWDDGSRLIVDGKMLIDDFTDRWDVPTRVGRITLERGQKYSIELHHRENVGGSNAHFEYEVPSAGITGKRIVPKSQFFPVL